MHEVPSSLEASSSNEVQLKTFIFIIGIHYEMVSVFDF